MSKTFVNINGPVVGDTVRAEGELVARDTGVTLPSVVPKTVDVSAMGTLTMPIWQLIENMEATITKIGVDLGLRSMLKPGMISLEVRWVQTVTDAGGQTRNVGCKAFLRGMVANLPEIGLEVGSIGEHGIPVMLTATTSLSTARRCGSSSAWPVKVRIFGVEYADLSSML